MLSLAASVHDSCLDVVASRHLIEQGNGNNKRNNQRAEHLSSLYIFLDLCEIATNRSGGQVVAATIVSSIKSF